MRLEVDENLPRAVCDLLQCAGRDAISVGEQGRERRDDAGGHRLCPEEQRELITLDVDFASQQAYGPKSSSGGDRAQAGAAGQAAGAQLMPSPVDTAVERRCRPSAS
jgi:hypothetical protein